MTWPHETVDTLGRIKAAVFRAVPYMNSMDNGNSWKDGFFSTN